MPVARVTKINRRYGWLLDNAWNVLGITCVKTSHDSVIALKYVLEACSILRQLTDLTATPEADFPSSGVNRPLPCSIRSELFLSETWSRTRILWLMRHMHMGQQSPLAFRDWKGYGRTSLQDKEGSGLDLALFSLNPRTDWDGWALYST
jgi:hypothetical protein